ATPPPTPSSASSSSSSPPPYRTADEPSPKKRQRYSSTPRQPQPSTFATADEINAEREASALRMFDVWSTLAEKYSRRIDEDDIVDLVTGEIVKDRGVLSAEPPWKFGRFADDSVDDSSGSEDDEGEGEGEDDIDELDLLAPESLQILPRVVPPVQTVDPADAKDLEEFLEAEQKRRQECGYSEASEDEGSTDGDADAASDESQTTVTVDTVPLPEESDDELGSWGAIDESNIICPVDTPNDTEIIEVLDSPSLTPTPKPHTPPRAKPGFEKPRLQLHTPPHSRTPSILSSLEGFIPVATPPLSSSVNYPTTKNPEHGASRTRAPSRVRALSPAPQDYTDPDRLPKLNLAEVVIERGRSVHKRVSGPPEHRAKVKKFNAHAAEGCGESSKQPIPKLEATPQSRSTLGRRTGITSSPPTTPQMPRTGKRKRNSLSSESKTLSVPHADSLPTSSDSSPGKRERRSVSVQSRPYKSGIKSENELDSEVDSEPHHYARQMSAMPYYPPPPFYPYHPPYPHQDAHAAMPIQDQAQMIISQAMLQLSTLLTAPWPGQPSTPSGHRHSTAPTPSRSSSFVYPTTPHHPHTHPYVFNSGASVGTLPPSSPPSSSPIRSSSAGRRASLVPRSRSRGRRVSFKVDDLEDDTVESYGQDSSSGHGGAEDTSPFIRRDKGKGKMVTHTYEDESPTRKPKK
ncbi:hypothetical protein R3P38DRAFT_2463565, partial [Favolaschia claudopus]